MYRLLSTVLVLAMGLLTLTAARTAPDNAVRYVFNGETKLWVEGTSTLHDYSCEATQLVGFAELKRNSPLVIDAAQVTVPVAGLDCGNNRMHRLMQSALKSGEHPSITFRLSSATPKGAPAGGRQAFDVKGSLTIAGVTRAITMNVDAVSEGNGSVRFRGQYELLMSDYGVERPTAMLGTIRTNDKVVVHFDAVAEKL